MSQRRRTQFIIRYLLFIGFCYDFECVCGVMRCGFFKMNNRIKAQKKLKWITANGNWILTRRFDAHRSRSQKEHSVTQSRNSCVLLRMMPPFIISQRAIALQSRTKSMLRSVFTIYKQFQNDLNAMLHLLCAAATAASLKCLSLPLKRHHKPSLSAACSCSPKQRRMRRFSQVELFPFMCNWNYATMLLATGFSDGEELVVLKWPSHEIRLAQHNNIECVSIGSWSCNSGGDSI